MDTMNKGDSALAEYLNALSPVKNALGSLLQNLEGRDGIEHTPQEIAQQPFLWRRTARSMRERAAALKTFLSATHLYDGDARPTIVLTGAGTSDYIGQSVADLFRERLNTAVISWPTTRITANPGTFFAGIQPRIMVHFARSGNSPESLAALDLALEHQASRIRHVVITCNADGALAKRAQRSADSVYLVVLDEACNDRGLAMTSSYTNMVVAAQSIAYLDNIDAYVGIIDRTAAAAERFIRHYSDEIDALASLNAFDRAFFLGNGDLLGAASESALKVQELTAGRLIAKSDDTLAFRHGPVSAVNGRSLVSFFLSADAFTRRYELDVLNQYREAFAALGATTLVMTARPTDVENADGLSLLCYDPDDEYRIPAQHQVTLAVLVGQLLALFASYGMGYNVDNPTADSGLYARTVQGVRLYPYAPLGSAKANDDSYGGYHA